jgi:N-acetylglutamate synthase
MDIRDFTIADYDKAIQLWKTDDNIGLSSADCREAIEIFLERNPGLSIVMSDNDKIIGTLLCGHDGRRGYLYHLFVDKSYRRMGTGKRLVDACLDNLKNQNIRKCHLFIFTINQPGRSFWEAITWTRRNDIDIFSIDI